MAEQTTFERIKAIIVELLGVDPAKVTLEARFREDLEADSLDLVELIMEMEETFDVQIADNELEKIRTIKDVLDYLKAKGVVWHE